MPSEEVGGTGHWLRQFVSFSREFRSATHVRWRRWTIPFERERRGMSCRVIPRHSAPPAPSILSRATEQLGEIKIWLHRARPRSFTGRLRRRFL